MYTFGGALSVSVELRLQRKLQHEGRFESQAASKDNYGLA
jgi:hypothetical protein